MATRTARKSTHPRTTNKARHGADAAEGFESSAQPRAGGAENPWLAWWSTFAGQRAELPKVGLAPEKLVELQQAYVQKAGQLWNEFIDRPNHAAEPIRDNRFSDSAWTQNPLASFYARTYLLNSEFMNALAGAVDSDATTRQRIKFAVSQWVDAMSPSNFLALNPKAQKTLIETKGESLKAGLQNLLADMQKGKITMTDENAFEVGRNVATSEGAVVYENEVMQLIQYKPLTAKVRARPLLLVPPAINKFYIMDLQPDNSLVRYCVEQGNTTFLISWRNVQKEQGHLTWDDYVEQGIVAAIRTIQEICGMSKKKDQKINVLGFCVGGTILASALAVMAARGEQPAASLTLMTAMLDFCDVGPIGVFIDEKHVQMRERTLGKGGIMPGKDVGNTFSVLRPNDLVWNYVVNNYLEGKQPAAFDLLYWNGDNTNLPGPMYAWYLRHMYQENALRIPNRLRICGEPVDLGAIRAPAFVFAAIEDHIVPWKSAYASARLLKGAGKAGVRYVLGASGHIAGSINPVTKNRRSYWTSASKDLPADAEAWRTGATENPGSWWADWNKWLEQFGGGMVAAPKHYGSAKHEAIEPAPGSYVKQKA
jgi:polyhydroxyalkanoate synthase